MTINIIYSMIKQKSHLIKKKFRQEQPFIPESEKYCNTLASHAIG